MEILVNYCIVFNYSSDCFTHLQTSSTLQPTWMEFLKKIEADLWSVRTLKEVGSLTLKMMENPRSHIDSYSENENDTYGQHLTKLTNENRCNSSKEALCAADHSILSSDNLPATETALGTQFLDLSDEILVQVILRLGDNRSIRELGWFVY